jgi:hypothetical protein
VSNPFRRRHPHRRNLVANGLQVVVDGMFHLLFPMP